MAVSLSSFWDMAAQPQPEHPNKKRPLFEQDTASPVIAQPPVAASKKRIATLDDLTPKMVMVDMHADKDNTQEAYTKLPGLKAKSTEFINAVIDIDQAMDVTNASMIVNFGARQQQKVGELVTRIAETSSRIQALGVAELLGNVLVELKKLDYTENKKDQSFWSKKSEWTVEDLVEAFSKTSPVIDSTQAVIRTKIDAVMSMLQECDVLLKQHAELETQLEHHAIAGTLIVSRFNKSVFVNTGSLSLMEQFEKRVVDLKTFQHVMLLALEQAKVTQNNVVSQVMEANNMLNTTIPVWKWTFSSLITSIQSKGLPASTPLSKVNEPGLTQAVDNNAKFITTIQGALHDATTVRNTRDQHTRDGSDITRKPNYIDINNCDE